jgi:hypothetical protein
MLLLALGIVWPSFSARRSDVITTTLLLVALLTLYMVFRSRRFIEYYPAFALLYCAVLWGRSETTPADWLPWKRVGRGVLYAGSGSAMLLLVANTLTDARQMIQTARDVHYMAGAANWLESHTAPGTPVFQTDWDDFPYLFYHNTHNTYLVGLDPTYLERANAELWDLWVAITRGNVEQPSTSIRSVFGTTYVISDTRHDDFEDQARDDDAMRVVYRDAYSIIWEIVSEGSP